MDLCSTSAWIRTRNIISKEQSQRLYALVLSQYIAKQPIALYIDEGIYAAACNGPYPVVEDVRTP